MSQLAQLRLHSLLTSDEIKLVYSNVMISEKNTNSGSNLKLNGQISEISWQFSDSKRIKQD